MALNLNDPIATYSSLVMRLPPLFIMDKILSLSFGMGEIYLPDTGRIQSSLLEGFKTNDTIAGRGELLYSTTNELLYEEMNTSEPIDVLVPPSLPHILASTLGQQLLKICSLVFAFFCCQVTFSLCWSHLLALYSILGSFACVIASYQSNIATIHHFFSLHDELQFPLLHSLLSFNTEELLHHSTPMAVLALNYIIQTVLYFIFVSIQVGLDDNGWVRGITIWGFLLPSCSMLITFSRSITFTVTILCVSIPLLITNFRVLKGIPYAISVVRNGLTFGYEIFQNIGVHALIESEWRRLQVPCVLRLFWIIRAANIVAHSIAGAMAEQQSATIVGLLEPEIMYGIFKDAMMLGCDTVLAVLGMTSVVSFISHYIGLFFQMLLLTEEEEDRSMGTVSAIIFFILAEQSGLTVLENEKRYIRLCRNFCLLFTAMLYFVHSMVNPVLMSLSASRNSSVYRHLRAQSVCFLLILLPATLLYALWSVFSLSTWLLAVSAFCIQVIIKTFFTLLIYALFLADAHYCLFWENLDDYVYYIKAVGNTIEFIFGIILFFNGLWIYFFESGGAIRAFMMCVHAYINIWCEAKNGWSAFIKRRDAVNKIASIPDATAKQLEEHDDVCTICFQPLNSAKITACKHFYHEICLRKWLYVQDTCPVCHQSIYQPSTPEHTTVPTNPAVDIAQLDDMMANVVENIDPAEFPRHNVDIPEAADVEVRTLELSDAQETNDNKHSHNEPKDEMPETSNNLEDENR